MISDIEYWIWLSLNFGGKHELCQNLLKEYGDAKGIYSAGSDLYELAGTSSHAIDFELDEAVAIAEYCSRNNVGIVVCREQRFPSLLKRIHDCPILLYYRGELPELDSRLCIAAVGTRSVTEYGERAAYQIAYDLAKSGAVIISGMAAGIDGVCHQAALDAGGLTVAVLGCGVDRVYPAKHEQLMSEIIRRGCVISEFKPGTSPVGYNFPIRNRIISGLCQATFVAEANLKSGSLITARDALYQGRDLFALPGAVGEQNSSGTNELIKSGAKMATNAGDILAEYEAEHPELIQSYLSRSGSRVSYAGRPSRPPAELPHPDTQNTRRKKQQDEDSPAADNPQRESIPSAENKSADVREKPDVIAGIDFSGLGEAEKKVYGYLLNNPDATSDTVIARLGISASEVMTAITMLEIQGKIESLPGGHFVVSK